MGKNDTKESNQSKLNEPKVKKSPIKKYSQMHLNSKDLVKSEQNNLEAGSYKISKKKIQRLKNKRNEQELKSFANSSTGIPCQVVK